MRNITAAKPRRDLDRRENGAALGKDNNGGLAAHKDARESHLPPQNFSISADL